MSWTEKRTGILVDVWTITEDNPRPLKNFAGHIQKPKKGDHLCTYMTGNNAGGNFIVQGSMLHRRFENVENVSGEVVGDGSGVALPDIEQGPSGSGVGWYANDADPIKEVDNAGPESPASEVEPAPTDREYVAANQAEMDRMKEIFGEAPDEEEAQEGDSPQGEAAEPEAEDDTEAEDADEDRHN